MSAQWKVGDALEGYAAGVREPANLASTFDLLATAPDGVSRLRELILSLGVRGKLVPQSRNDGSVSNLEERLAAAQDQEPQRNRTSRRGKSRLQKGGDEPFELPAGWLWFRLGNLAWKVQYGYTTSAVVRSDGPRLLRITDIQNGKVEWSRVPGIQDQNADLEAYFLKSGDLLIARTGGTIGKSFLIEDAPREAIFASYLIRVQPKQNYIVPAYLRLFCGSPVYWGQLRSMSMGTGQPNVNGTSLSSLWVPLAPIPEQARIVARAEQLMKLCDSLEENGRLEAEQHARLTSALFDSLVASESPEALAENWRRVAEHFDLLLDRPEAVDALEQTILQLGVHGLLGTQRASVEDAKEWPEKVSRYWMSDEAALEQSIPEQVSDDERPFEAPANWLWVRIETLCDVQGGIQKTPLRRPVRHHFPYLRVANVQRDNLILDRIERYELTDDELERWRLRAGDLLIVEGNGSEDEIGRCALWDGSIDPCVFQNHLIRVRPYGAFAGEFLTLFLNSPDGIAEMKRLAITTSGLYNLSVGKIRSIPVPVPPLAEQRRIVARAKELRRLCVQLREHLVSVSDVQRRLAEAQESGNRIASPVACARS